MIHTGISHSDFKREKERRVKEKKGKLEDRKKQVMSPTWTPTFF